MKIVRYIFKENGSIKKWIEKNINDNQKLDKYSLDKLKRKDKWL